MKILPVGAEFFHANGQTDVKKISVAFGNFANAPYKEYEPCILHTKFHYIM